MSRCVRSILASLALLAALGVVLGIGLAVVYADHIYSPYEGLTKLQVIDPAHDASGGFDARFDELVDPDAAPGLLREAVLWAKTSHDTLLRQNALETSCLALVLPASFSCLGEKDLVRLLFGTTLVSAAVLLATGVVGWLWLSRRLGVKGGRP